MAIEKIVSIDKKEILANGIIQIRQVTKYIDEGVEVSKSYHRWCLSPNQSVLDQPQDIKDLCALIWTTDVIDSYLQSAMPIT